MKANELRIGNLGKWKSTNRIESVKDINSYPNGNVNINSISITDFEPIQLNDEWFKKCGAKLDNMGMWWFDLIENYVSFTLSGKLYYPNYGQSAEFSHMEDQVVFLRCVQYVHELQNLYFTLTGSELTIV